MGAGRPSQQGTRKRKSPQADARNFPETGRPQTRGKWRERSVESKSQGTENFAVPRPHKQRAACWGGISASSTRARGWESQSQRGAGLTLCKTAEGIKLQLVPLRYKLVESRRNYSPKFCSFSLSKGSQALPGTGERRAAARVPGGREQPRWRHWGFPFCRGGSACSQQRGPGAPTFSFNNAIEAAPEGEVSSIASWWARPSQGQFSENSRGNT